MMDSLYLQSSPLGAWRSIAYGRLTHSFNNFINSVSGAHGGYAHRREDRSDKGI